MFPVYELSMFSHHHAHFRRIIVILSCLFCGPVFAGGTPSFLILKESADFSTQIRKIESAGAEIRQRVPPRIAIGNIPANLGVAEGEIEARFTGVIDLSRLETYGPAAVAAGLQWNKKHSATKTSMGAMSVSAPASLETPRLLDVKQENRTLKVSWTGTQDGLAYEIQWGAHTSITDRTSALLPIDSTDGNSITVKVRALDRANAKSNLFGSWSEEKVAALSASHSDPAAELLMLTSPADGMQSSGFSLILEWTGATDQTRVQVSKSASFDSTLVDEVVTGHEFTIPSLSIFEGDKLFWRVKLWEPGDTDWTKARSMTVGAPRDTLNDALINPEAPR